MCRVMSIRAWPRVEGRFAQLLFSFQFVPDAMYIVPCLSLAVATTHVMPRYSSYGSVFKALHKDSGKIVAIKQVPVDSDLQARCVPPHGLVLTMTTGNHQRDQHHAAVRLRQYCQVVRLLLQAVRSLGLPTIHPFVELIESCCNPFSSNALMVLCRL